MRPFARRYEVLMLATPFLRTTRALTLSVTTLVFARTIMEALTQAVTPENIPQ